jgi:annexin A7/11
VSSLRIESPFRARQYDMLTPTCSEPLRHASMASEFSGHMKDALIYIARYSENDGQGIQRDAELLEAAMSGMGTKDERLIWRIVRLHWNRPRFEAVKQAYQGLYGKSLRKRVEGETTGKYEVSLRA